MRSVGDVDLTSSGRIDAALTGAGDLGARITVLDLRDVTFMDSTGLRLLIQAETRAGALGGRLQVLLGREPLRRILRLARLEARIEIVDSDG
ncbi:MAG: STAS domain-containing protein [Actinomycetota bacterium]